MLSTSRQCEWVNGLRTAALTRFLRTYRGEQDGGRPNTHTRTHTLTHSHTHTHTHSLTHASANVAALAPLGSDWHMGEDDSDEARTLTQNHLVTLKITSESWRGESGCYLRGDVAEGGRRTGESWGNVAAAHGRSRSGAERGAAAWWQLSGTDWELQRRRTGPNWLRDGRKWHVLKSREREHRPRLTRRMSLKWGEGGPSPAASGTWWWDQGVGRTAGMGRTDSNNMCAAARIIFKFMSIYFLCYFVLLLMTSAKVKPKRLDRHLVVDWGIGHKPHLPMSANGDIDQIKRV